VDKKKKMIVGGLIAALVVFGVMNGLKKKKDKTGDTTAENTESNTGGSTAMTLATQFVPAFGATISLPENAKETAKGDAYIQFSAEGGVVATGAKLFKVMWADSCLLQDEAAVRRNAKDYNYSGTITGVTESEGSYTVEFAPQGIVYTNIRFAKIGDCHVGVKCDGTKDNKANVDAICASVKAK